MRWLDREGTDKPALFDYSFVIALILFIGALFYVVFFTTPTLAQEATSTATSTEGVEVDPQGRPLFQPDGTPIIYVNEAALPAAMPKLRSAVSSLLKGTEADVANTDLIYGKLNYISDQIKQLHDACTR